MAKNDTVSKSWFCVFNNPEEHGYGGEPQEIIDRLKSEWIDNNPTRTGAWAYCISADGLKHVHMVLEDTTAMRFSKVKASYALGMHFEPTKGNKEQAEDYIHKRGKFEEKGEEIVAFTQHGEIKGCQGSKKQLEVIEELISMGLTPTQIKAKSIQYYRDEKIIISAYRDKRNSEIPFERSVLRYWHVGESGTGKSYVAKRIVEERGEEALYFMTDYENGCFDSYMYQPVLFMDEYRGQFTYNRLLTILDVYKHEEHARFCNVVSAWNEVHISSVKAPEMIYANNIQDEYERTVDTFEQLKRRIDFIVYHWKDDKGYHLYEMPMKEYKDYRDLVFRAAREFTDTFVPLPTGTVTPFRK